MPTEQEMIRVIAERVMGWKRCTAGNHAGWYDVDDCSHFHWNPFTSWADAGMVLDKVRTMGKVFIVKADGLRDGTHNPGYTALLDNMPRVDAISGPRAISLAAYEWAMQQEEK